MWQTSFLLLLGFICTAQSVIVGYDNINYTAQFQDYEAEFGTEIGANGLSEGILVAADPPDACAPITHRPFPRNIENITVNAFVLIQRGKCDFAIKVLNAQEANFNAAIVSNVGSDELLHMGTYFPNLEDQIHIPSVFVGEKSGKTLNSTFIYTLPNDPHIRINRGEAPFSFKLYLIPFMAVVGCSFLILVCFVVVRALRERRRRMRSRLSRQRLKQLPSKQFHKGDDYDVCAICLDDYEEGDTLRILPCKHAYHCKCVDPWLTTTRRVCPLCKRRVLSDDDVSDSDDYDDDESDSNEEAPLLGGGSRSRSGGATTTSSNPSTTAPNHQYGATTDMTSPYNNAICSFVPTSATPLIPPQSSAHAASGDYQQDPTNHMIFSQSAPTVTQAQQLPRMDDYIIDMSSSEGEEEEDDTSSSSVDSQTADDEQHLVDEPAVADDDDKLDDDEMTHGEEESLLVDTSQESSSQSPHSG